MSPELRPSVAEGGRGQGNAPGAPTSVELVVHPGTGEVFDETTIEHEPPENLAELVLALREHQSQVRKWEALVVHELERRLAQRPRSKWLVGDFEIEQGSRNSRAWDGDELARVLDELVDEGVATAQELVGIVERKTVVHGREALRLQQQLRGDAHERVAECWHWERKAAGLTVTRSLPLVAEGDEPQN
jgi:hypothetical protein